MLEKLFLNKNFFLLWTGQMISQIGDKFYAIALAWWILQKTNSSIVMGVFMAASVLPGLIFGIIAGVFIDKYNRKFFIIGSDILRGACVMIIALLSVTDRLELWHIFAVAILLSLASSFFDPTVTAVIPQIVKKEDLTKANSLSEMIDALSNIIGPMLGATFVSYFGFNFVFLFNGMSYLISAFFEMFIVIPRISNSQSDESTIIKDIKTGIKYILDRRKLIITIMVIGIAHLFVGALVVSLPILARELSKDSIQVFGSLQMMLGIGMLMGAISIQLFGKKELNDKNLFTYIAALGVFFVSIAITKSMTGTLLVCYLIILLFIGATIAYAAVYWQSILQVNTSHDMAGRVFSISSMVGNISLPLSYGLFGVLLKFISIVKIMIFSGAALIIISMILMYFYNDTNRSKYSEI
jgi:MFS family permease